MKAFYGGVIKDPETGSLYKSTTVSEMVADPRVVEPEMLKPRGRLMGSAQRIWDACSIVGVNLMSQIASRVMVVD
jgi:hypothetical protein